MSVRAKMVCESVEQKGDGGPKEVRLHALYSSDPSDPNYSYSQATPSAELRRWISNPAAYDYFVPGKSYVLTFEAEE